MNERTIPSTGEALPVVGCGTYIGFDHSPGSPEYERLPGVLASLFSAGGRLLDSSPMYGRAEATTGELLDRTRRRVDAFLATKVWTHGKDAGIAQMERSFALLGTTRIDLMQIHNLADWRVHLQTLREWKEQGRVRYIGITHYNSSAYGDIESILNSEPLDFLQINYSLQAREAESRILPLAADKGVAVLANMPLGGPHLMRMHRTRPLPQWALDMGCKTWSQVLLKFVLSHHAVTCAIPGTGNRLHMAENMEAGMGNLIQSDMWRHKLAALALE